MSGTYKVTKFHTISNMEVDGYGYQAAMFGSIPADLSTTTVVKNFSIVNANVKGSTRFSMLYAAVYSPIIVENVYVNATVTGSGDASAGFVGYLWKNTAVFKNCVFEGAVNNASGAGAFVGDMRDDANIKVSLTFENCLNVSSRNFVGKYANASNPKETMTNSYTYDPMVMGTGSSAKAPDGFSTRSSGYPVPTTLLPFFTTNENPKVKFVYNGATVQEDEITEGSLILEKFPTIKVDGIVADNVIWINQSTGAIVEMPYTATEETVIVAKIPAVNDTDVIGVQLGDIKDGKQSMRFIGGVYNLEGSAVGLEITVSYKENGETKEKKFTQSVTTVYTSISATESGEIKNVTAKELGATYLYAVVLEDVPTNIGELTIKINSFKSVLGGKLNIPGTQKVITVVNGVIA